MPRRKSAEQSAREVYSGLSTAYRVFQAGRLACGDITVLAEILVEAGVDQVLSEATAEAFWDAYESTDDFGQAVEDVMRQRCSVCRLPGHNKRTCNGWIVENLGLGH